MNDEYVIVVDENNVVVGQEKRQIVHQTGLFHRGVHVFLFTPEGKLVTQRRSATQDTFPGALDCSVSEHLQVGESYHDGAIRGLQEELGIDGVQLKRRLQFKMGYGMNDNMISELYEGVWNQETLTPNQDEIDQIAYRSIAELETLMISEETALASWFTELLNWYTGKPTRLQVLWEDQ